ncbi:hypothetical protein PV326_008664 [Microctonus aethiopoides]|nr:hypothetical protein PV326_008664 [Microctonus aethiopoides]
MPQKRAKGKFIKAKVLKKKDTISAALKAYWSERRNKPTDGKSDISDIREGNRIFNSSALANNLQCKACKDILSFKNVVEETRDGLHSTFSIKCVKCEMINQVNSGNYHIMTNDQTQAQLKEKTRNDITTNVVLGTLNAGLGCTELNKLLMCLDIPELNFKLFKKYEREIGPVIEAAARRSCRKVAAEERKLVLSQLDELQKEMPVKIRDEFAGVLSSVGIQTNPNFDKTLGAIVNIIVSYDMGWSKRGNGSYDSLNGYGAIIGSAKAMEADAGAELLTRSTILNELNLNVKIVVGDEDSFLMSAVNKSNHGLISHLKKCFSYAIAQNKGDSAGLAKNVCCIPHHLFDQHDNCGKWCKKFCISASSQGNEAFNHSVTRKFPKNKNFSMSASGDTRVAYAVLVTNEGNSYLTDVKKSLNLDVSNALIKSTKVLDQNRVIKYNKALTVEKKREE